MCDHREKRPAAKSPRESLVTRCRLPLVARLQRQAPPVRPTHRAVVARPGHQSLLTLAASGRRPRLALSGARRWWHPARRMILWLLASAAVRVAALYGTLTRAPAVLLGPKRLDGHRKHLWLRGAGRRREKTANQHAKPSVRSLVDEPPNSSSNGAPETCRRKCFRRTRSGRAPPPL